MTDHEPFISTSNIPRLQAPFCIERIRLKWQGFSYTVEHIHGANNLLDYLSWLSSSAAGDNLKKVKDLEADVN